MQIQPRFGAILVKELSFKQGHGQSPVTHARFQLTGADLKKFKTLLTDGTDEVNIKQCNLQSGGIDREFKVNWYSGWHRYYTPGNNETLQEVDLYKTIRAFLKAAPLTHDVRKHLLTSLENISGLWGESGRRRRQERF